MTSLEVGLLQEVGKNFHQIKDFSTEITRNAVNTVTQTAVSAIDNVTSTTKNTSTAIENSLSSFMNKQWHGVRGWIDYHPVMSWATKVFIWGISHPILSVIIIISSIFILRQFIKALSQFIQQIFLYTLQAPFKFGQFILGLCLKLFGYLPFIGNTIKQSEGNVLALNTSIPASISHNNKERLAYILNRLEAIRQEQNQLLQEVTAILASNENSR